MATRDKAKDWQPQVLVELAEHPATPAADRKVLKRLMGAEMKSAWREARKRNRKLQAGQVTLDQADLSLWFAIKAALAAAAFEAAMRKERLERYPAITDAAKKLAKSLRGTLLDDSMTYGRPSTPTFSGSGVELLAALGVSPDMWQGEQLQPREFPAVSDFLNVLADDADRLAKAYKHEPKLIARYSNTQNARRLGFLRALGAYFVSECGIPLYTTTATFGKAALSDKTIDATTVRESLRDWLPKLA